MPSPGAQKKRPTAASAADTRIARAAEHRSPVVESLARPRPPPPASTLPTEETSSLFSYVERLELRVDGDAEIVVGRRCSARKKDEKREKETKEGREEGKGVEGGRE